MKKLLLFSLISLITASCHQKTTNGKTLVVDVRQKSYWAQGHACDGINIPLSELEKNKTKLLKYDTIIFVCETGESAQQATSYMNAQQDHATVFRNGISWVNYQDCP